MALFYNVKGSNVSGGQATTELVPPNQDYNVRSLLLVNLHDSADATVTLFIQNDPISGTTNTYEITHGIPIPATTSLFLSDGISLPGDYGLYISVGNNDLIDVTVNT